VAQLERVGKTFGTSPLATQEVTIALSHVSSIFGSKKKEKN
jgi:hypothetical protein